MRANTLISAGLALTVVLVLAGCSKDSGPRQDAVTSLKLSGVQRSDAGTLPPEKPVPTVLTLPGGTTLMVRTTTALSTNTQQAGQTIIAHLEQPLMLDGREIFARGAEVEGRIVESDKGGRVKGRATLAVRMTRLHTADGQAVDISTSTIRREAHATKRKDAAKIGIGGGIGAAAGGGAGTGLVLATHGDPAVIPSETVLHFALRSPVTIAGAK